jgi:hypothetical protein
MRHHAIKGKQINELDAIVPGHMSLKSINIVVFVLKGSS